jgi:hypothetical protein
MIFSENRSPLFGIMLWRAESGDCRNLVTGEPFCLRKVNRYGRRPQGIAASGLVPRPQRTVEVVVPMHKDHQVMESESGALWPALWVGAAVVAMVAFSYWLNLV